jgi:V/A-type H+-transporting ATPase subunit C
MSVDYYSYAYAVGRIRVLETRLFDNARLERMAAASSTEEVLNLLGETSYSGLLTPETLPRMDFLLWEEEKRTLELLLKISPQPHLLAPLALTYDVHNLKVMFKEMFLGENAPPELFLKGTFDPELLKKMPVEEDFSPLTPFLRQAAESIKNDFQTWRDPQVIDLYLDRALQEELVAHAQKEQVDVLEKLFSIQADLVNLQSFFRTRSMNKDREFLRRALLPHGSIPVTLFENLLEEPVELLGNSLSMSPYAPIVLEGTREWVGHNTLFVLEKLADNFITTFLQAGKRQAFGLEPLIGYLHAKQMEVKNLRLVLVGKINDLPPERIRERLRHAY